MVLTGLKIKNFRGFSKFETNRLSQFTLIAGENDVGKTSLLEAIFMLSGMRLMDISARINGLRHLSVVKDEDLNSIFYAQETDREVFISGNFQNGLARQMVFSAFTSKTTQFQPVSESSEGQAEARLQTSFKQRFKTFLYGKEVNSGELKFLSDSQGVLQEFSQAPDKEDWKCLFLTARQYVQGIGYLKRLIVEKRDYAILKMLQRIDADIQKLILVGEKVFVDKGLSHLLPIQLLGDGLLKTVNAFAAVLVCEKGGTVCIDEIDNGLHFTAMNVFWEELTKFALEQNVQIIATTHDSDFLEAVAAISSEKRQHKFTYLRLNRRARDGIVSISALPLNYAQYASAVEGEVEVR